MTLTHEEIEEIRKFYDVDNPNLCMPGMSTLCDMALRSLSPTAKQGWVAKIAGSMKTKWIDARETLPDPWVNVLVVFDNGDMDVIVCGNYGWAHDAPHRITHWMPLPAAPRRARGEIA